MASLITALRHFGSLYALGAGLKRHGALAALQDIDLVPKKLVLFLRVITWPVPRKRGLPDSLGDRLAAAFAAMGPAYIKLGQTLATRPDVTTSPIAVGLTTLQDRLPAFSGSVARQIIESELGGPLADFFTAFDDQAIAAASIAQVHKAQTPDGQTVAVKVLRADIEKRFEKDLALFDWLANLGERFSLEGRRLKMVSIAQTVRKTVTREMDLRLEAAAASELRDNMLGEEGYRIPNIDWDRSARRVLTLEWIEGIPLTKKQQLVDSGHDLSDVARRLVTAFLNQAMRDGYFHGDLHQGNFLLEDNAGIVALDFGIMGRMGKKERFFLAEVLFAMIRRDYRRVAEVHFDLGYVPRHHDIDEFAAALRAIADPILDRPVREISAGKLLAQLFETTERFDMQTRLELLHLQRSMVMVEGLALHLDPDANMWEIARPTLEQWARENLSLEVRLADAVRALPRLLTRLLPVVEKVISDVMEEQWSPQTRWTKGVQNGAHDGAEDGAEDGAKNGSVTPDPAPQAAAQQDSYPRGSNRWAFGAGAFLAILASAVLFSAQ